MTFVLCSGNSEGSALVNYLDPTGAGFDSVQGIWDRYGIEIDPVFYDYGTLTGICFKMRRVGSPTGDLFAMAGAGDL